MRDASVLRSPFVHFLVLGVLAFALVDRFGSVAGDTVAPPTRVALAREQIDELRRDFETRNGRAPDASELRHLVSQAVDEELLYREALVRGLAVDDVDIETRLVQKMTFLDDDTAGDDPAQRLERARSLGLEQDDIVVRRILIQKLRLLATALAPEEIPGESELAEAFALRRESFRAADRRALVHVFLGRDRRGERTPADAAHLRRQIEHEQIAPTAAVSLGDPFPFGHELEAQSEVDLARSFGETFAASTFALEPDQWSQPIESAYGLHLVRVDSSLRGEVPELEAVRERLRLELEEEARIRKLAALLAELRTRYEVAVVEPGEEGK
jgi:peptidyl-prolyl cis-trans isomerase C